VDFLGEKKKKKASSLRSLAGRGRPVRRLTSVLSHKGYFFHEKRSSAVKTYQKEKKKKCTSALGRREEV